MALWSAAGYEYDGVVKLLLERDGISPNIPGTDGGTPLLWAACQRHDAVVELLLGREDVNPNIPATNGMTPLSVAAVHVHDGMVRLLLGRQDVNPDVPYNEGLTPLAIAACQGHDMWWSCCLDGKMFIPDNLSVVACPKSFHTDQDLDLYCIVSYDRVFRPHIPVSGVHHVISFVPKAILSCYLPRAVAEARREQQPIHMNFLVGRS